MAVCAVCKTGELDHPGGLFFHACDDWGHYRLFLCSTCLKSTPLQRSGHEQCYECSEPPPKVESLASSEVSPRFNELYVAMGRFERVHRQLLASVPFVSFNDDPNALHPGSLNTAFLKEWLKKYGGDECVGT